METESASPPGDLAPGRIAERASASAWYALAVFVIASIFGFVDRQALALLAEPMRHALHLSDSELGIIQGLGFAIFASALPFPVALLADRYDRRVVLSLCVTVWSLATAACGLAQDFRQLFLATIGMAAGETGFAPIFYSVLPDLFTYRQRVTANFIAYLASILGMAAGVGFGGAAIAFLDANRSSLPSVLQNWEVWRLTFIAVAMPGPLLVILISLLKLPRRTGQGHRGDLGRPVGFLGFARTHRVSLILVFASIGAYVFASAAPFTWLAVILVRFYGLPPDKTGMALGVILIAGTAAGVLAAASAMRFLTPRYGKLAPLRVAMAAMIVGVLPYPLMLAATSATQVLLLIVLMSAASVAAGSLAPNLLQDMAPGHLRARVLAIYTMVVGPIAGASGILIGFVSDLLHREPRPLILALVLVGTPGWLIALLLMRQAEAPLRRTISQVEQEARPDASGKLRHHT